MKTESLYVAFLTRSLEYGGAERQLVEVVRGLKRMGHAVHVITFYPGGDLVKPLEEAGVPVISLQKRGRWEVFTFFFRLLRAVRGLGASHLYAFLGIPCILSVFVKLFVPDLKIVWGVRSAGFDLSKYECLTRFSYKLECVLSCCADLIISNSSAGREFAAANGFPREKMIVISNGIDTEKFTICREAGLALRNQWGVAAEEKLVGLVARLDVMKDHPNFIRAAAKVARQKPGVKFVCVGDGPQAYVHELEQIVAELGLNERFIWAGSHTDMAAVYNAFDAVVLSSYVEGVPNVVGEAMACGVPCVVTDVGDAAWLVGDTGIVVPPRDSEALAAGITGLLGRLDEKGITEQARNRICQNFRLEILVQKTVIALSAI